MTLVSTPTSILMTEAHGKHHPSGTRYDINIFRVVFLKQSAIVSKFDMKYLFDPYAENGAQDVENDRQEAPWSLEGHIPRTFLYLKIAIPSFKENQVFQKFR